MKISNGFKRFGINAEASVDYIRSRYNGVGQAMTGALAGGFMGAIMGGVAATVVSDIMNEKDDFIDDVGEYHTISTATSMPSSCDSGGDLYFATKGPNGDYSLYKKESSYSGALQNQKQTARFVEDFKDCLDEVKSNPDMQDDWTVYLGYEASQPLRAQDINQTAPAGVEDFRAYRSSGGIYQSLTEWQEVLGAEVNILSELQNQWADALDDFQSGDTYNQAKDKNVQTMTYEDDYQDSYWEIAAVGSAGCGLWFFGLGLFGRNPSSEYRERGKNRDERRAALAHDNFKF